MADFLLDTTVFCDLRKGDADARKLVESILNGEVKAAVSPLTVCELWQSDEIDRRTEIGFLSVLRFVEEAAPDIETARTAGLWLADAVDADADANTDADADGDNDGGRNAACVALVAATAMRLGIPVCTRDDDAFERFGVEIAPY